MSKESLNFYQKILRDLEIASVCVRACVRAYVYERFLNQRDSIFLNTCFDLMQKWLKPDFKSDVFLVAEKSCI